MKRILFLICLSFVALACDQRVDGSSSAKAFVDNNTLYGVYTGGKQSLVLNDGKHQQCISRNNYRLQTDDQGVILNIELDRIPTSIGDHVSLTIYVMGIAGIKTGQMMFTLEKAESGTLWLWNQADKMGVVLPSSINM